MGLPVERIVAEVEEEMLHKDEEVNKEQLLLHVNGEPAEVEHLLDEDELNEDLEKDLDSIADGPFALTFLTKTF